MNLFHLKTYLNNLDSSVFIFLIDKILTGSPTNFYIILNAVLRIERLLGERN